jgi:hypothetical protein
MVLALGLAAPATAADRKPPRINSAAMKDADGDGRADRIVLRYSERVSHAVDRARFPFTVASYTITRVNVARSKLRIVALLKEKRATDATARPSVRYQRTKQQPVRDRAGNEAANQLFTSTRAFGVALSQPTPSPSPTPTPSPSSSPSPSASSAVDLDGDGSFPPADCAPENAAVHPNAADPPDYPAFADTNCDGIDGTATDAIFVSKLGSDSYPGTRSQPKLTFGSGVVAAAVQGKTAVYATGGEYTERLDLQNGVSVYGGYGIDWSRAMSNETKLTGATTSGNTEGARAVGISRATTLQFLTFSPTAPAAFSGGSSYGLRAFESPGLVLHRVTARGAAGASGPAGANGTSPIPGSPGGVPPGSTCTALAAGGTSPVGRHGGAGGSSCSGTGGDGASGLLLYTGSGTSGGPGGLGSTTGSGGNGYPGDSGSRGLDGNGTTWGGVDFGSGWWDTNDGSAGAPGIGGHGGGGGGGAGNLGGRGGGGGGGGGPGGGGRGGQGGGGSFGVLLVSSSGVVVIDSTITSSNGGSGSAGGFGVNGAVGGTGGLGVSRNLDSTHGGNGGNGGPGGRGGDGGGGAGGPTIALARFAASVTVTGTTFAHGVGGAGGAGAGTAAANGVALDQN